MEIEEEGDRKSENTDMILNSMVNEMIERVIAESNSTNRIVFHTDQIIV